MAEKPTYEELEQRVREYEQAESKRKIIEETNKNTSELLSFFIKHSPIYAFLKKVSHKDSQVLYASDNYIYMTGIPASQMVGKTMHELFPKEFAEKITIDDIAVINNGNNLILDEELNGRNYVTYKFPIIQDENKYLAGYTVDITDLKRTEGELAQIFTMSLDMICIADINTATFLKVNPAFTEILGYSEAELLEKPFSDFIHPEDISGTRTVVDEKLQMGDKVINFENRYRCKDGSYRWLSWVSHPNMEKGVTFAVARDITESKHTQELFKKNKALLDVTGRMAKVGGWELNVDTLEITWTEETYRIHEVPQDFKPSLKEAINFFHPEDREKLSQAIERSINHGEPYDIEVRFITAKGKNLWTRTICHPEIIDGKTANLKGIFQDITKQKMIDEALKASEKKYHSLFQNAQVALFRNRLSDGKILEINERYAKVAGYSTVEECMAEFNAADAWGDPNGREELLKILQENGFVSDYETVIIRKDGSNIWISFSATIFPEQGFLEGSLVDITERKRSEIERENLQAQLIQAQKMESVGRLAGGVAHDFNNMLGVILGRAELGLKKTIPTDPVHKDLEQILNAADRSADITRQLLAFARKQTIAPKVIDLNDTVDTMLQMLGRLIGEDIDLLWQPADDLWKVKMDPSQIDQILVNLCVNARDAIANVGKITIETGRKVFDTAYCDVHAGFVPGEFILLAVSDNGNGMDKDTLDNLFEPFFTTKKTGSGTGLGLATVYGIVKQNNGFINVYSEPEKGSSFRIYLPRHIADMAEKIPDKHMAPPPRGSGETILIVEDEATILEMLEIMLESLSYTILTADSPSRAMEMAYSHAGQIHLVITDVVMPEMNGRDLAEKLSALYPGINILFMSGYTANVIAHQGVLDDGVAFIQKPFSMANLAEKVRDVLDKASDETQV